MSIFIESKITSSEVGGKVYAVCFLQDYNVQELTSADRAKVITFMIDHVDDATGLIVQMTCATNTNDPTTHSGGGVELFSGSIEREIANADTDPQLSTAIDTSETTLMRHVYILTKHGDHANAFQLSHIRVSFLRRVFGLYLSDSGEVGSNTMSNMEFGAYHDDTMIYKRDSNGTVTAMTTLDEYGSYAFTHNVGEAYYATKPVGYHVYPSAGNTKYSHVLHASGNVFVLCSRGTGEYHVLTLEPNTSIKYTTSGGTSTTTIVDNEFTITSYSSGDVLAGAFHVVEADKPVCITHTGTSNYSVYYPSGKEMYGSLQGLSGDVPTSQFVAWNSADATGTVKINFEYSDGNVDSMDVNFNTLTSFPYYLPYRDGFVRYWVDPNDPNNKTTYLAGFNYGDGDGLDHSPHVGYEFLSRRILIRQMTVAGNTVSAPRSGFQMIHDSTASNPTLRQATWNTDGTISAFTDITNFNVSNVVGSYRMLTYVTNTFSNQYYEIANALFFVQANHGTGGDEEIVVGDTPLLM